MESTQNQIAPVVSIEIRCGARNLICVCVRYMDERRLESAIAFAQQNAGRGRQIRQRIAIEIQRHKGNGETVGHNVRIDRTCHRIAKSATSLSQQHRYHPIVVGESKIRVSVAIKIGDDGLETLYWNFNREAKRSIAVTKHNSDGRNLWPCEHQVRDAIGIEVSGGDEGSFAYLVCGQKRAITASQEDACGQVSGSGTHAYTYQVEDSITIEIGGENLPRLAERGDDWVSEPEPTNAGLIQQDRNSHGVGHGEVRLSVFPSPLKSPTVIAPDSRKLPETGKSFRTNPG
jgi:hypothetical protein